MLTITQSELNLAQRYDLAEVAGRGALNSPSLAILATRIIDPLLVRAGRGIEELEPEALEYLNDLRRKLGKMTARHSL